MEENGPNADTWVMKRNQPRKSIGEVFKVQDSRVPKPRGDKKLVVFVPKRHQCSRDLVHKGKVTGEGLDRRAGVLHLSPAGNGKDLAFY